MGELSKEDVIISPGSIEVLRSLQKSNTREAKVVIAGLRDTAILAVGPTSLFHVDIIDQATHEVLNSRLVTSTDPNSAKPIVGVVIEGGRVKIDWHSGEVSVFGKSDTFGGFNADLFDELTETIVQTVLQDAIKENLLFGSSE